MLCNKVPDLRGFGQRGVTRHETCPQLSSFRNNHSEWVNRGIFLGTRYYGSNYEDFMSFTWITSDLTSWSTRAYTLLRSLHMGKMRRNSIIQVVFKVPPTQDNRSSFNRIIKSHQSPWDGRSYSKMMLNKGRTESLLYVDLSEFQPQHRTLDTSALLIRCHWMIIIIPQVLQVLGSSCKSSLTCCLIPSLTNARRTFS